MTLQIDLALLLLTFLRLLATWLTLPLMEKIPTLVKIMLALACASFMSQSFGLLPQDVKIESLSGLFTASCREVCLGISISIGFRLSLLSVSVAGGVLDAQFGLSLARILDPTSGHASSYFGVLMTLLASILFFLLDAHHQLLRGLHLSLELVPPGHEWTVTSFFAKFLAHIGVAASIGVFMVGPVFFVLCVVEVGLAYLAKIMPQLNVLVLGMPVKFAAGLATLAISMPVLLYWFKTMFLKAHQVFFDALHAARL